MNGQNGIDLRTAPYAALGLRVTLGVLAILHLYWKFFVRPGGLAGWWMNFNNQGYPDWLLYYVLAVEFAGAICFIPGIAVRWVALFCFPMMVGAAQYWAVRNGFFFTVQAGAEMPTAWAIMLLVQAGLGDGAWALVKSPGVPAIGKQK